jgi:hypothetical protein
MRRELAKSSFGRLSRVCQATSNASRADAVASAIDRYSAILIKHQVFVAVKSGLMLDSIDDIRASQSEQRVTTEGSVNSRIPKIELHESFS